MPDQTEPATACEDNGSRDVSHTRVSSLFDRVTRLEVYRESDVQRVAAFEQDMRAQLVDIGTKLDTLLESASQRKGLEKIISVLWDLLKLAAAAVAGVAATKYVSN